MGLLVEILGTGLLTATSVFALWAWWAAPSKKRTLAYRMAAVVSGLVTLALVVGMNAPLSPPRYEDVPLDKHATEMGYHLSYAPERGYMDFGDQEFLATIGTCQATVTHTREAGVPQTYIRKDLAEGHVEHHLNVLVTDSEVDEWQPIPVEENTPFTTADSLYNRFPACDPAAPRSG